MTLGVNYGTKTPAARKRWTRGSVWSLNIQASRHGFTGSCYWPLCVKGLRSGVKTSSTPFDWISRDEAEVDAYVNDPLCGFLCSSGFYRDLAKGLRQIHRKKVMARIRRDLPVYIFCGGDDPVGNMGASPAALVNAYRSLGLQNLEFVQYPGARHETLNETNREEVMGNLSLWISRIIGMRNEQWKKGIGSREEDCLSHNALLLK